MNKVANVIGGLVANVAWSQLRPVPGGGRPWLRVTNFSREEIRSTIDALQGLESEQGAFGLVTKVGTSEVDSGIPDGYRLSPGQTLTHWRNASVPAVLLIDWDVQGDEEGLAASFRLDDVSLLGDLNADVTEARLRILASEAWRVAGGAGEPLQAFHLRMQSLRSDLPDVALRKWVSFVVACAEAVVPLQLKTPDEVDRAIGASMAELGLFPDPLLFLADDRPKSRLTHNMNFVQQRTPGGADIDDDDLIALIDIAEFTSVTLDRLGISDPQLRDLLRRVVQGYGDEVRASLDLEVWYELFARRNESTGLGALVRENLAQVASERVPEFDALDVQAGLDEGKQPDAEIFVRAEPVEGATLLVDLLTSKLRRRVEKLAFPDARLTSDPLRALLHELHLVDEESEGVAVLLLEDAADASPWSMWLFSLLFGPTLRNIAENSGTGRLALSVDVRLLDSPQPSIPEPEDDFEPSNAWAPLRLALSSPKGVKRRFRWSPMSNPGQIAFAALLTVNCPEPGAALEDSTESLFERFLDPRGWSTFAGELPSDDELSSRMRRLHNQWAAASLQSGITADSLDDYVNSWSEQLQDARINLVPANSPDPQLEDVVLTHVLRLENERLLLLATHPLRLRWFARHLRNMSRYLLKTLSGGLQLNSENSDLFFHWLDGTSPHGTPPLIVGGDELVAIAARESGWHEEYVPVSKNGSERRDWLSAVDDAAVDELVRVVETYLSTYPYKSDGLKLLLLDRDGSSSLPLRLARRLTDRQPGIRFQLHVFADASSHHGIVEAFDNEFADVELAEEQLLPNVQLVLTHWAPETPPDLESLSDKIDLALAPAVFGTVSSLNSRTRNSAAGISGAYDPWIHASSHDLEDSGQNVVRVMLPSQRDPLLESWATLCARATTHAAVSPSQESNTDYFELTVRFDRHQRLFSQLHAVAHWVVTLDAFVGRDQIDALDDKPDVILVRPGVGKNESYTLLVSSSTGREFVVNRLARKLRNDLGFSDQDSDVDATAARLYDVGRHVVPGAVLRSLGLGRAANEVLGLVASRFVVEAVESVNLDRSGLVVWISFDEQQDWFGQVTRTRADIGRFALYLNEASGTIDIDILVVESKYRTRFEVGAAETQLDRTTTLTREAFNSRLGNDDIRFWLQELASAIEQTSAAEVEASDLPARTLIGPERDSLEETILQILRSGEVDSVDVRGVAVAIASGELAEAPDITALGAHRLIRLNRPELAAVIDQIVHHVQPQNSSFAYPDQEAAAGMPAEHDSESSGGGVARGRQAPTHTGSESVNPSVSDQVTSIDDRRETEARGLGEEVLRERYERLLDVLAQHGVKVAAPASDPWQEGPGFYVLRVIPKTGVTVDRVVSRVNEIALALRLPAGSQIRSVLDRGSIVFEIPKADEERYFVEASELWNRCAVSLDSLVVPIGEDISGEPIQLEFSSPDSPHLLVAGTTGAGKSGALDTIIRGLARYPAESVRFWLVDPKGTELSHFEDAEHVDGPIGYDAADAVEMLECAVVEMDRRYALMKPLRVRSLAEYNTATESDEQLPWVVLVLDEYADLTSDPGEKTVIEGLLRRLTQKARAAGIHVIAATQRPSADVISTTIRSNLPAQLALRVKTATDSRIIMDEAGAEALAGQGDAFLKTARGVHRIQVGWSG
mgnify:FL=1